MKKLALFLVVPVAAIGLWWTSSPKKKEIFPADYLAKAEKRQIDFSIDVNGEITPDFLLDVRPEVGGKIKNLPVSAGQQVKKGELLAEIDDTDLLTERKTALTEIDGAKISQQKIKRNLERAQELQKAKLISKEVYENISADYESATNTLAKAQRRLETVEDRLRKTKILAPMDGTLLEVKVIEGQVVVAAASVNSGTTLMSIADLTRLLVDTHVNQVDVTKLKLNQKVTLTTEAMKDLDWRATICFIAPLATAKNNVKGFKVQALIENADQRLRPGMTVNMTVPIASVQEALSVPVAAVFKDPEAGKKVIYVVKEGGVTEKREVKVGITDMDYVEIRRGVEPGEEILLVDPRFLKNS